MRLTGMLCLCLIAIAALTAGCRYGPDYDPETYVIPTPVLDQPIKRLIISDFYTSLETISASQSGSFLWIRQAINVEDVSGEMASALAAKGFPTRAKIKVSHEALKPGEVLLRGLIRWEKNDEGPFIILPLSALTVFTLGLVLPFPWPYTVGAEFSLKLELIDHEGNILFSNKQKRSASYWCLWLWGAFFNANEAKKEHLEKFKKDFVDAFAKSFLPLVQRK